MLHIDSNSRLTISIHYDVHCISAGKIQMLCISALPLSFKYRDSNPIQIHCHKMVLQKDVRPVK